MVVCLDLVSGKGPQNENPTIVDCCDIDHWAPGRLFCTDWNTHHRNTKFDNDDNSDRYTDAAPKQSQRPPQRQ